MSQTCSKTTKQQRDDMRDVVNSVIADKKWFPIVTDLAVRVLPILDDLEAAERDTARLDFIISESNEGRGWLEDSVWDVASNECEGGLDDTPASYVRAHIDDQMKKSAVKESNAEADRMAGATVEKTVAKEEDSKGFEGITQ